MIMPKYHRLEAAAVIKYCLIHSTRNKTRTPFKLSRYYSLPSPMSSSRSFPTTFVSSSSRVPRDFADPLILNKDVVPSCYDKHKTYSLDTAMHTMQLRREHVAPPSFHEFVMILTWGSLTYVPPRDVIAPLQLTSWEELDRSSYCMVESCWGGDKLIYPQTETRAWHSFPNPQWIRKSGTNY